MPGSWAWGGPWRRPFTGVTGPPCRCRSTPTGRGSPKTGRAYALVDEQLRWFDNRFPVDNDVTGLELPAHSGWEAVFDSNDPSTDAHTSDASHIVYSVPFYGPDGHLRGAVAGVILT